MSMHSVRDFTNRAWEVKEAPVEMTDGGDRVRDEGLISLQSGYL